MNYKEILLMILNSDDKLSKEYAPILKDIDTQILPDISNIDDTCSFVRTGKGFIAVYMDGGDVIMEYVYGGTGSFKSCTKLIEFVFNPNLEYELPNLKTDKLSNNVLDEVKRTQFCASCTMFNLKRDTIVINHVTKIKNYVIEYNLRKMQNNDYLLHGYLTLCKPICKNNNYTLTNLNVVFTIAPEYQSTLKSYSNSTKTAKLNNSEFNDYSIDDFCNEYGDCISKYDENPFNNFSQLDPGTYNSETDEFTTDDDIDSDNELFGL